jgi:hypothetical protein
MWIQNKSLSIHLIWREKRWIKKGKQHTEGECVRSFSVCVCVCVCVCLVCGEGTQVTQNAETWSWVNGNERREYKEPWKLAAVRGIPWWSTRVKGPPILGRPTTSVRIAFCISGATTTTNHFYHQHVKVRIEFEGETQSILDVRRRYQYKERRPPPNKPNSNKLFHDARDYKRQINQIKLCYFSKLSISMWKPRYTLKE